MNKHSYLSSLSLPSTFVALSMLAACGSSKEAPAASTSIVPAATAPAVASPTTLPAAPASAEPAPAAPDPVEGNAAVRAGGVAAVAGKLALATSTNDERAVVVYEIAGGQLAKVATIALPRDLYTASVLWPAADQPIIVSGATKRGPWFGTIADGQLTPLAVKLPRDADPVHLTLATKGEVWGEYCSYSHEEGCGEHAYVRIWPRAGKAASIRLARPDLDADMNAADAVKLAARESPDEPGRYVLDCVTGGETTTLFATDQLVRAPTWNWISVQPPIAIAHLAIAGWGDNAQLESRVIRGCEVEQSGGSPTVGTKGLWSVYVDGMHSVRWKSVELAQLDGEQIVFPAGVRL